MYLIVLISQTKEIKADYQLSISQNSENLAIATLQQQREIKD
jgi:hypothetical protein